MNLDGTIMAGSSETAEPSPANKCTALTKSGDPCRAYAMDGGLCHLHTHPERAQEIGQRGGQQNKHFDPKEDFPELPPLKTAEEVRQMLAQAAVDLRHRKIEPRMAVGLTQIAATLLKAIEVAQLEQRIKELEEKLNGDGSETTN